MAKSDIPPAHATPSSPLTLILPMCPGLGLGTMLQARPSKRSVRVRIDPSSSWVWPTAHTSAEDSATVPKSSEPSPPRFGRVMRVHVEPFQCSVYGLEKFLLNAFPS